jgi:hypothetical protein
MEIERAITLRPHCDDAAAIFIVALALRKLVGQRSRSGRSMSRIDGRRL